MTSVLILGAGKIGRMITAFLSRTEDYQVQVADVDATQANALGQRFGVPAHTIDASHRDDLCRVMADTDIVISALSYRFNPLIAQVALETGTSYFDLTEDVETTRAVRKVSESARDGQIFMPQCGLAPGFVSIVANHLTEGFDTLDTVFMRVGALPQFPSNALKYNLTWSTDGLINEYCNPCDSIHEGRRIEVLPMEGLEHFSLDGVRYEAFNTSGGLGTLCETLDGQARELNYKTIRYLGHRDLMTVLVNDLRLSQRRDLLKDILEKAIPVTYQDVVVVFCTVSGQQNGQLTQLTDARRIYHEKLDGEHWGAIQITTAAGMCAVVDLFVQGKLPHKGFVKQEQVRLEDFINNRFGRYYDTSGNTGLARQIS
ncbi:MAG: saccharopine dehydrogenase family protein [Fuerstiella sp.]|nr:saccharopine dehydrogenase family protein [Fuerstiella sp.]MCP4858692.1 saccharopine dehydrogenase family protein [Fuerstiella sp.]